MTTEELKALEAEAKKCMEVVNEAEGYLQVAVTRAITAIKAYHQALGFNPDETHLCIHEGCPNVGDFERPDGQYECEQHYTAGME